MKSRSSGAAMSLGGVAILAACACGTSSRIAQLTNTYGLTDGLKGIHPWFVIAGSILIVAGLWRREHRAAMLGTMGVGSLFLGELLAPPMSVHSGVSLTSSQISGLAASIVAAILLIAAFYRAYPSRIPSASLTAVTGAALATGCNCCLITMAIAAPGRVLLPDQGWASANLTFYLIAMALVVTGLARLSGFRAAGLALIGQAFLYFWLELPYSAMPTISLHGVNVNFIIKYPMMILGAAVVMTAFVLAYRTEEKSIVQTARVPEPAFGD